MEFCTGNEPKKTAKQIEAELKKEAAALTKEQRAIERKAESARKKEAKAITKKTIGLASKLSAPLANAFQKASDIVKKAEEAGLETNPRVEEFRTSLVWLEEMKKKCNQALSFYMKNPNGELADLGIQNEKEATGKIRDIGKEGQDLMKQLIASSKKK